LHPDFSVSISDPGKIFITQRHKGIRKIQFLALFGLAPWRETFWVALRRLGYSAAIFL
jgi:hypothetical protein